MSNLQLILDAVDKYAEQTGINLQENPFVDKVKGCDSPDAVLLLLQENMKVFNDYQDKNRRFIACLGPLVQFVHAFSAMLGEAAGPVPFQPAKLIFVAIDVLFTAADRVSASYDALLDLFECIGNFLKRLNLYTEITLDPFMKDIVAKIMVELISILSLTKKHGNRGRLEQFAKKLLGDSEIETILKRLDRLTQEEARMTVAQALAVVQGLLNYMKVIMDGGEASTSAIRRTLVAMQEVANGINKTKRDRLQKDARSWISPPDPSKNHAVARRTHSGDSAVWFTRGPTFKNWDLTGGLLWIHGIPGSGKSILCSSIIEQATTLCDQGLGLVAYYYFDFRDTSKQEVRGMLSSLVIQLCAKSDLCHDVLSRLYSKHDAGLRLPDDDTLTKCLTDMLKLTDVPPIYIIIDALDESPDSSEAPSPRTPVLDFIKDLVASHLPNLRICVTSRPEADIQATLGPLVSHAVSLHDEAGQKQDIMDYISSAVQSDAEMEQWEAEDRKLVIDTLSQRADGMFKWVSCQIEWLRSCFPQDIRHALDELPETLDATYERTLLGIGKAKRDDARRILQCIAVSIRPLRVEELAEVLAVRLDAGDGENSQYRTGWRPTNAHQAVLSICSSLITVVNVDGSPVVQFSHFSVKEFMMSSRLANAAEHLSFYHILPYSAHDVLARASLSVILSLGDQVDKSTVEKRPFAIYAARYWVDHGKFKGVLSSIRDLTERLFDPDRPYFRTWIWIYDVDRPWIGSMKTVRPTQPEAKPLYYAALCGFRSLVDRLTITHQTDVNARGGDHGTALNAAFAKGEVEIAWTLIQNGANINVLDGVGESSLHRAISGGHRSVVKMLLEHQADVNIQSGMECETPLYVAVRAGDLDICRLLLKHGADVASRDQDGRSALHWASQLGHINIVQDLLDNGADANAQDDGLWTPLHWVSNSPPGSLEIVQSLVRHGAALDRTNTDQETPLHMALRLGCLNTAHFLIEQGANTMSKDKNGDIPLHNASRNGQLDLVKILLEGGVVVNAQNAEKETPLGLALSHGNLEVASLLIESGADVDCRDRQGWTPLHNAARNGHLDTVRLLLNLGIGVQVENGNHHTPLMPASQGGHVEVSRFLIEHQVDANSVGNGGWTSLHLASRYGHANVVRLLLDHGVDVNVQKSNLWTPLHLASINGHLNVAELLIDHGAEVDEGDEDQKTPLQLASGEGKLDVARLLVKCRSNVNSQDHLGWTPLHSAVWNGHLDLVELLLDSGADVGIRNSSEKTPLDLSQENLTREEGSQNSFPEDVEPQLGGGDSSNDKENVSLHTALKSGYLDLIQRVLDGGADVNERDELLRTPLDVASTDGKLEIARILIKYGADVNAQDATGWTPLHSAVGPGPGHIDVVRLLLDNGANICATQREGLDALHLASGCGHFEIVQLLLEQGADVQVRNVYGRTPSQHALLYGHQKIAQLLSEYNISGV